MVLPEAKTKILEDGTEALIEGSAELVGEGEEVEGVEFTDLSKLTAEPEQKPEAKPAEKKPAAAAKPAVEEEEIPEELRGKTPAQLAKMYRDAHATIGRQGTELGELRRKADLFIQASLATALRKPQPVEKPKEEVKPLEDVDFFAAPRDAIARAIAADPIIKEIRESLGKNAADRAESQAVQATEKFNATHPDAVEIMKDPEFRQWVSASPIRRQLLTRAHQRYDYDAGDEVFSTWKALRGTAKAKSTAGEAAAAVGQPSEAEVKAAASTLARAKSVKAQAEAAAKAAAAPTGGASAGKPQGSTKIYRRADVMRLMEDDPDRYQELAPELDAAYREGRVR